MKTILFVTTLVIVLLLPASVFGDSAEESLQKGKEALEAYKLAEALSHLTEAIRLDPKNPQAYYYRGRAHADDVVAAGVGKAMDRAIADFTEAIRLDPKYTDAFVQRGSAYSTKSDYPKAIADLSEAIRLDPKHAGAWLSRSRVYYESGEYAKSVADCRQAIQIVPHYEVILTQAAEVLAVCPDEKCRDGKKAVEYATEACELTKWKDWISLEALAASYAELGQFDDAVKWQKKAIEILNSKGLKTSAESAEGRLKHYEQREPLRYRTMTLWVR